MEQSLEIIQNAIQGSLNVIEQDREREIITRRFGLSGPKETLEQIGELLSITRERVRQLEKAILVHLRVTADEGHIPELPAAEKLLVRNLTEVGRIARVSSLADKIYGRPATNAECANLAFLGSISPQLTLINDSELYHLSIGIADYGNEPAIREKVDKIVSTIKANKNPMTLDQLDAALDYEHPSYIEAVALVSRQLAALGGVWGLIKWSSVNPRNIRDKIYVILSDKKEPLHFTAIAQAIADSNFKRKNVTIQAIHNELIKDPRFVLIGRGIYALSEWGYKKGTITDIICRILQASDVPLSREEIVKQVLRARKVKETTILLNLQNKKLFKKTDKNSYTLA